MLPQLLGPDFPLPLDRPWSSSEVLGALGRRRMDLLLGEGLVRRVVRGVYAAAQAADTPLFRAQAIRLVVPDGCVVTDESAGWLAGARMILRPGSHRQMPPVTVFRTDGRDRLRNDLTASGTRQLLPRDITEIHGVRCTTPLRTALDLGRLRHRDRAIAALDQLLALGVYSYGDLRHELPRFRGMRGVRQLRVLAPFADGRSESPGESALRLRFLDAGQPVPEPQREVFDARGRFLGRVDLLLEELGLVAEYYGDEFHGEDRREHDERRAAAIERAGLQVVVFRKHNVFGPRQDAIPMINRAVREARSRASRYLAV